MGKDDKTNVMRVFDAAGVKYEHYSFDAKQKSGAEAARETGADPESVFKTLVTVGKSGEHYVFMVPVLRELNLKLAAAAAGEKSIAMIKEKELLPLTGYVHGGCSPVGMKKQFRTFIDKSAERFRVIYFSGGKVGRQVSLDPKELEKVIGIEYYDL
ncbi:MAG: Cys-tRNA(Pro) deacylase, partial [Clostridia bacterium]|nr:Cys-tRNA(Pro) deacylase [Clostridia bacterium]